MSTEPGTPCSSDSNEERVALERYIDAWNAGDAEALSAMTTGDDQRNRKCKFEAALATGYQLDADWESRVLNAHDGSQVATSWRMDRWTFDLADSMSTDGILSGIEILPYVVASYQGDNQDVLAYWDCDGCEWSDDAYTPEQRAVIEEYAEAFNARDLDAVVALYFPSARGEAAEEWNRTVHEALFATGLFLSVDLGNGTYEFYEADGSVLNPGFLGPCIWPTQQFAFFFWFEDGDTGFLQGTRLGHEVVQLDDARHFLDETTRAGLDEALSR